jgi:hypothetical protein
VPSEGTPINAFAFGDHYAFKHYFGSGAAFRELQEYYLDDDYRFEVPAEDFEAVRETLAALGFDLRVVEDPEPYCVAVEQYEPHADVLRASVAHWSRRGHEFFLMPDEPAVREAVQDGATRVAETDLVAGI